MNAVFVNVLNRSITAGWIVLAVLALRLVLKSAPKWTRCALWGLVGLRLLLPFSLKTSFSLIPNEEPVLPDLSHAGTPRVDTGIPAVDGLVNPALSSAAQQSGVSGGSLLSPMTVLWLAGMLLMLAWAGISWYRVWRQVQASVKLRDNVYLCDGVSPFILGLFRPRIYLPFGLDGQAAEAVIAHEEAHLKRKDHWWKPLGFLLLSVFWINPLLWLAYGLLSRDIELACDERVIRDMAETDRIAYSQVLLDCSAGRFRLSACPLAFGENAVKTRIRSVLNYRRPAFWILTAAVLLILTAGVLLLTDPKMKNYTLTIGDEEYTIRSTARLDAEFKEEQYTADGEPVGTLYLTGNSIRKFRADLSALASCEELQLIRIQVNSELTELILPSKEYLSCYVQAGGIGRIAGENAGGVDLILNGSPSELDFPYCAVNDLTVEGAMDLNFLKKGVYRTVSLFRSNALTAPDASCDIGSLSLSGGDWDLTPLAGNETLTYLSVDGYGLDLSPLIETQISQLYLGGVCDLTPLREMPQLKILHVRFSDVVQNDLTPLQDLQLEYLNIVTDWGIPAVTGTRNLEEVTALCDNVPGLSGYLPVLLTCATKGAEIGTTPARPGLVEDGGSVFDMLPGTVPEAPETPTLPSEEPSDPLMPQLAARIEGYYDPVAVYHPEMQQPDMDHEAFRVSDGRLYGFLLKEGEWEDLGEIRTVNVSEETAQQVFQYESYTPGYLLDPPGLFRTLRYRAVSGNTAYYFDVDGPGANGEIACVENGRIRWFVQVVGKDALEGDYHYACTSTEAVLPWQLDFNIYDRTYVLEIPCHNTRSEGSFRFREDGQLEITDAETGIRHYFLPDEKGYRTAPGWLINDGVSMKEDLLFRSSGYYFLKDLYGTAELDMDGDGIPEKIFLGDRGFSGPLGLTVSVDSAGTDAYRACYAEWGDVSLVTEKGKVYGEVVYHVNPKDQGETKTARFRIHYDGTEIWLFAPDGSILGDNIDLRDFAE